MKGFNMESIAKLGKMGLAAMNRNLPSILSGAAIAGIVAAVWTTYKATPEINSALESAKWDKTDKVNEDEETVSADNVTLTKWETFKAVAPYVWKPAACVAFSAVCVVSANVLNVQRLTMLAGAYKLSEKKLQEYEEKAKELLGEKKATELHDEVVKSMCDKDLDKAVIEETGTGEAIFYDLFSGRYFRSNMETIRTEESRVNRDVANGDFVTLNTLYNALGLDGIRFGDDFGWGNSCSVRDPQALDIDITYEVRVLNGKEVAVGILDYKVCVDRDSFGSYFRNWVR